MSTALRLSTHAFGLKRRYTVPMSDEILVEGVTYISSKRASEITTYAQDYIGQLARSNQIEARRIGGLWYINLGSLESYKSKPEQTSSPQIRQPEKPKTFDDVAASEKALLMDGKEYISANRASQITGYNQDYVGQLARSGKISAKQIGNRWFVSEAELISHKTEKDNLLAAVQVSAVGLPTDQVQNAARIAERADELPLLRYSTEQVDLSPRIQKDFVSSRSGLDQNPIYNTSAVPVQRSYSGRVGEIPNVQNYHNLAQNIRSIDKSGRYSRKAIIDTAHAGSSYKKQRLLGANFVILFAILLIILAVWVSSLSHTFSLWQEVKDLILNNADRIEKIVSPDLVYQR